jgi:hypothetical protein
VHIDADAARTRVVRVPLPRITDAERNEIDLAESLGPAARLDQAKQEFKSLKEKAEHYVTADGRKIGGDQVERGDFFTFLNKLLKHELKRASESLAPRASLSGSPVLCRCHAQLSRAACGLDRSPPHVPWEFFPLADCLPLSR